MTIKPFLIAVCTIIHTNPLFAENQAPHPAPEPKTETPCIVTDDNTSCTKFVGCFGNDGIHFRGNARGRGIGTLLAKRSDGVICTGTWTSRNALGTGQADFKCENGENGRVIYYYQDEYTGTAKGKGMSSWFNGLQMWSGENLKKYFSMQDGLGRPILKCGPVEALIS